MINKYSNVPLYCQLKSIILDKINSGEFSENMKIPSEQEFCEQFEISRPTVRQAINELTKSGHLYKQKGKGTFVTESKASIHIKAFTGFSDSILDGEATSLRDLISVHVIQSDSEKILGEIFSKDGQAAFAEISYVSKKNSEAISLNVSYIPLSLFPNICEEIKQNKSAFEILKGKYPLVPASTKSVLEISYTDQHEANYLRVQPGQALIKIKNTLYSKTGQPVEHIITKYRADKCQLVFENTKK